MKRTLSTLTLLVLLGAMAGTANAVPTGSATITGTVGENVSTTDHYDGRFLRYVGNPAPDGYAPWYQWGEPYILTVSPEDGPVTMTGTLDLSGMSADGQVAVIGLHDANALAAGDRGDKAGVGIYVSYDGDGSYVVGVTDGDAGGGEFVQEFVTLTAADLDGGVVPVTFVVDGTADTDDCASDSADLATADGCMTLTVDGRTVTDSYGTIVPTDIDVETELGAGAHPGWYSAYAAGDGPNVGVGFDLTVDPVVLTAPRTADDCKNGGYAAWDFKNQGLCVASVQASERAGK